jgi:hypothetical protein
MDNLLAWILMAAISLPLSYFMALGCLRALVRMLSMTSMTSGSGRRHVL